MSQPPVPSSRREARATTPPTAASPPAGERTGIAAIIARHPRIWLGSAIGVAFLLLAVGALFAGAALGSTRDGDGGGFGGQSASDARPVPTAVPDASRLRTCSVSGLIADPALGTLIGAVTNATTGEVLLDRSATGAIAQGGVAKVVTAAAAITVLGPDTTISTRVYEGSQPNTLVLVGGGDPTLTALSSGESVYAGAPRLDSLVDQVENSYSGDVEDVTAIVLDATLWSSADKWDASWPRSAQTGGTLSEVTALQVDGDRADPTAQTSPRGTDPVTSAGRAFAAALGLNPDDVTFSLGSAVTSRPLLGTVTSQPVSVLVTQMLQQNDNTLAEHLARLVSKAAGSGGSGASINQVMTSALGGYGLPVTGVAIADGSGVSPNTVMPPAFVAALMAKVLAGADNLNYVYNSLSVAGQSGLLAARFAGTNAPAQGQVVGQPGSFPGGFGLAGIVSSVDGTPLAFSLSATGEVREAAARVAIESLVTAAMACGDNLSNT